MIKKHYPGFGATHPRHKFVIYAMWSAAFPWQWHRTLFASSPAQIRSESSAGLQRNAKHPNPCWNHWILSWTSEDKRSEPGRKCRWQNAQNLFPWSSSKAQVTSLLALWLRKFGGSVPWLLLERHARKCNPFLDLHVAKADTHLSRK